MNVIEQLYDSILHDDYLVVDELLLLEPSLQTVINISGESPLFFAVKSGSFCSALLLLHRGADVHTIAGDNTNLLEMALNLPRVECCSILYLLSLFGHDCTLYQNLVEVQVVMKLSILFSNLIIPFKGVIPLGPMVFCEYLEDSVVNILDEMEEESERQADIAEMMEREIIFQEEISKGIERMELDVLAAATAA